MAFAAPLVSAVGGFFSSGVGAGLLGAAGSIVQGIGASRAAGYQARVAEMNARISEDNAVRAQQRAQVEQMTQDRQTAAMLGEQRAAMAGSGLDLNSSSFIRTRAQTAGLGRMDALNVRQAGDLDSFNYRVDASSNRASANLARLEGRNSLISSAFGAATSLVGGSTSTARPNRITGGRRNNDPWMTRAGTSMRRVTI